MYGVSKITSQQNIMLITFPGAEYSAANLAEHLNVFAREGVITVSRPIPVTLPP